MGSTDWPHLVHLPPDHTFVSRMHLHIELAWFESVPVSPGRRLVFSWLAGAPRD